MKFFYSSLYRPRTKIDPREFQSKKYSQHLPMIPDTVSLSFDKESSGIFSSTFLQPVNGSKNSILNWVLKLNLFISSKALKDFLFYSPIHLSDSCSSRKCIFQWSGDLNFKNPPGDHELSNNKKVKKLNLWRKTAVNKSTWIKAWYIVI